ncbi:MAG: serine/threonine protein kinase [Burkholderiales bacterium]|nr:serine/threonine protein kinase [Burkholderiales bacterium]
MNEPVTASRLSSPGTDHWPELSRLLDDALDIAEGERGGWLASLPATPAREALARLLAQQAQVESANFLGTLPRLSPAALASIEDDSTAGTPRAGDVIGPWRLLRELGQGGMGAVWLAERTDGQLKRQVALKLPRASWSSALAERLARERDILATLEHPPIARLYDAGVDALGRPWLALEHVEGRPIDEHVRHERLDLPAVLGLLLQVAQAVHYAHERQVVHRDLKPSNILVTADGRVRLLDFGIAKLLQQGLAAETRLTQRAGRALTPDYASPEQIRGEPVGTASDIYSLSVVAYELLAGVPPYRVGRRSAAALEEAALHLDPPPASRVAPDRARARALRGDLDAVLNRGLKKAPAERYASVAAWADDLRAVLEHRPVQARPDSVAYLTARLLRRHRAAAGVAAAVAAAFALAIGVGATTLVIAVLALGLAAALWQAREAQRGRAAAEAATRAAQEAGARAETAAAAERAAAEQARRDAARAGAIGEFMFDVFRANATDQPDPEAALRITARELLERGVARVEGLREEYPQAHAQLLQMFGTLYNNLDQYGVAASLQERALEAALAAFGPEHELTQSARLALAWDLHEDEAQERAETLLGEALRSLRRSGREDAMLARTLALEADMFWSRDPARAVAAGETLLALMARLPASGTDTEARALLALGRARAQLGRLSEAAAAIEHGRTLLEARLGAEHPSCGKAWRDLGEVCIEEFDPARAGHAFAQAVRIAALHPRVASENLAAAYYGQARLHLATGALREAGAALERAVSLRLAGDETGRHLAYLLETDWRRAQLAWARGDMAEALAHVEAGLARTTHWEMPLCRFLRLVRMEALDARGDAAAADAEMAVLLAPATSSGPAGPALPPALVVPTPRRAAVRAARRGDAHEADRQFEAVQQLDPRRHLPAARVQSALAAARVAAALHRHADITRLADEWTERLLAVPSAWPRLPQAELALELCAALPVADGRRAALLAPTLDWLRREQAPTSPRLARAEALAEAVAGAAPGN